LCVFIRGQPKPSATLESLERNIALERGEEYGILLDFDFTPALDGKTLSHTSLSIFYFSDVTTVRFQMYLSLC
jgi:hypothetical protein